MSLREREREKDIKERLEFGSKKELRKRRRDNVNKSYIDCPPNLHIGEFSWVYALRDRNREQVKNKGFITSKFPPKQLTLSLKCLII